MRLNILIENSLSEISNVADAMVVAGRLRYSTYDKESESVKGGTIQEVISDSPMMVVIKNGEESVTFPSLRYAGVENDTVYLSGNGVVESREGYIARVRDLRI